MRSTVDDSSSSNNLISDLIARITPATHLHALNNGVGKQRPPSFRLRSVSHISINLYQGVHCVWLCKPN
eukprot:m.19290 g.19290  ORF g.19290 m.19290 type:complete len:69 (-) comp10895_c0_seq18:644-850(-)